MSEIKLELRERNEAIAMAYTKGYQQGRADVLMPYDVESIEELIKNVESKTKAEVIEEILDKIEEGLCFGCEHFCEGCHKECGTNGYEREALIKWLRYKKDE